MKQIPLTQGKFALVDDEDYGYLMQWKWFCDKGYAARSVHIKNPDGSRTSNKIFMHRVIAQTPKGMYTDHIDCDRANNQKSNLRVSTNAENNRNVMTRKDNTSGYKGVTWRNRRWAAQIRFKGKNIHLGLFDDKNEAARAYNEAALNLFGEFAKLNSTP